MKLIGIDASKGGWDCVMWTRNGLDIFTIQSLTQLGTTRHDIICIDMPLSLPTNIESYPRSCDKKAKSLLKHRHSTVFYGPVSHWLDKSYDWIRQICKEHNIPALSKQSYNLFSKIRELTLWSSKTKAKIVESHPELFFMALNGGIPLESKKTDIGLQKRKEIIASLINTEALPVALHTLSEDSVDAFALFFHALMLHKKKLSIMKRSIDISYMMSKCKGVLNVFK